MNLLISKLYSQARAIHPGRRYVRIRKRMSRVINRFRLKGDAVFCPCCKRRALRFTPQNICAFCESRPRQRFLWLYLETLLGGDEMVLHFAPEECLQALLRRRQGSRYVSADISSVFADHHVNLNSPDETVKRLGAGAYSIIVISHVLEHVEDEAAALKALQLLASADGRILIQVPIDSGRAETYEDPSINTPEGRLKAFGQEDHVRIYGADFVGRLEAAGFEVSAVNPIDICPPESISRMALKNDTIFVCRAAARAADSHQLRHSAQTL